jgi:thioesterase domain-containing protein
MPAVAVFDNKNPAELARYLRDELTERLEKAETGPGKTEKPLSELFREAVLAGKMEQARGLLTAVAAVRPRFASAADLDCRPAAVRLAEGPRQPSLICLPAPAAGGGVYTLARLAEQFRGVRRFSALPLPGFVREEPIPASAAVLAELLAGAVQELAGEGPYVLLGHSSGGSLGYLTAMYLEKTGGNQPSGVILLDSFFKEELIPDFGIDGFIRGMVAREATYGPFDIGRLSGIGHYLGLMREFAPTSLEVPVLFVRAAAPFTVAPGYTGDTQAKPWDSSQTVRTVQGNHFSIVEENAPTTADIIEEWLDSIAVRST